MLSTNVDRFLTVLEHPGRHLLPPVDYRYREGENASKFAHRHVAARLGTRVHSYRVRIADSLLRCAVVGKNTSWKVIVI